MFGLWNKKNKYTVPYNLRNIIKNNDFDEIVELSLRYLNESGYSVKQVEDGLIFMENEGHEIQCSLDNLSRQLVNLEKSLWSAEIARHFGKLKENVAATTYFLDDYEVAKQYLKVQIKKDNSDVLERLEHFIYRIDLPGTYTFLVFDFDDKFSYLTPQQIVKWEQPVETLFEEAMVNVSREEIDARVTFLNDHKLYGLFSTDFSAPYIIDLKNNCNAILGRFGCLVSIPTKGTAFVYPIETKTFMSILPDLYNEVVIFFKEDPGNISTDFYWYYDDCYSLFPQQVKDGRVTFLLPEKLKELFHTLE